MPIRSTRQLSITLPTEMADLIRAKVASGEYATESEVIRDGMRVLIARDRAQEKWLQEEVVSGGEIGPPERTEVHKPKTAGASRPTRRRKPTAPPAAAAPKQNETELAPPPRPTPEPPSFEFGRMQVVLKDAPG